ncbi:hypothetical protein [Embleya sp. NPDC059237]|uniref:hypothetical protein n=1 Tax=Embleya sp. NPDC059237 TaxID=3346784 RepID=UPI0036804C28
MPSPPVRPGRNGLHAPTKHIAESFVFAVGDGGQKEASHTVPPSRNRPSRPFGPPARARVELRGAVPVHGMDAVMRMYEHEGSRAAVTERAVGLVERALAGERWPARPRPTDPPD